VPVIGLLSGVSFESYADRFDAIRQGLKEAGFIEGQNVKIEYRSANGQYQRLPALAADLVRQQVAVIVAVGSAAPARAARGATSTIPIVFVLGTDPVAAGLVISFNRPEANVTGVSQNNNALAPKRLELLHELLSKVTSIAFLVNPSNPRSGPDARELVAAAGTMGCTVLVARASTVEEIGASLVSIVQQGARALIVHNDAFLNS